MKILGIDPGLAVTGYGVIAENRGKLTLIKYSTVRTKPDETIQNRLRRIYNRFNEIFDEHSPDACALETLFFAKNPKSVFQVGQVRGVLLLCASLHDVPAFEYSPLEVKQSVVGYGRAEKPQVQYMTRVLLGTRETPRPADAADALAIAICHANSSRLKKFTGR
ncbi:MAG: crossover junction endodeoxyribonuclease RuvC [bacterium]